MPWYTGKSIINMIAAVICTNHHIHFVQIAV